MPSAVVVRRGARPRSQSPPGGFDSARRTRPRLEEESERGRGADKPSATRARSPSPPGGTDSARRKRPLLEEERGMEGMASALPDDILIEVFKRLAPLTDIVRCAAVFRRWRQVVSGAAGLPAPPPYFGFYRNYAPSPLPPFVPTAGIPLDLGDLPVSRPCGVVIVDCRGRRLLLRELGAGSASELRLLVCDPLRKTSVSLPPRFIAGHKVACCALLPEEGAAAFRVVVVLFGAAPAHFDILVYSSTASAWEATIGTGSLGKSMNPWQGPKVVIGDIVYKLQSEEDKYIMAVHSTNMTLSAVPLPNTGMLLYAGNHWIGKTEDGRLCFFALREQLVLVKWVLESNGNWAERTAVDLRLLMNPATVGDLSQMKLSAKIADQLRGCKLVSFGGFCEGNGALFFVMADWVVALDLTAWRFERMWRNTDESRPLGDVFPIEMMVWPPASHGDVSQKE
uniref:F-box domain-containing protein n=1 Tax=Leersia perrieri TaxID=77586 RepID=A0A0D9VYI3_9ORYZ